VPASSRIVLQRPHLIYTFTASRPMAYHLASNSPPHLTLRVLLPCAVLSRRVFKEADHEGQAEGHEQQDKALTGALFGVLFTLSKEKNDSKKMAMATILIDFFLLFVLLITPDYPWAIHREAWYDAHTCIPRAN
jgi:hypothetical protein